MPARRKKIEISRDERINMIRLFIALSQLPRLGQAKINLVKLKDAYQHLTLKVEIV